MIYSLFASTPKATEDLLAHELKTLGAENIKPTIAGVAFTGNLSTAYRVCLWSRIASRVSLNLSQFSIITQQDLYDEVKKVNWFTHLSPEGSFAVSFHSKRSDIFNNTHFGALKVKDAIVDQMRAKFQKRPNIDTEHPDIRVTVFINADKVELSLDLSGESLHKRGFREVSIQAPMKENLAAAMLQRVGWAEIAAQGGTLIDPMCGSGTVLLEAAMIAADYAPGLKRDYYGFLGWKQHDASVWQSLLVEAETRKAIGLEKMPMIVGFDQSRRTMNVALQHVANAGLETKIHLEKRDIQAAEPAVAWKAGLVICNPPYGERLGDNQETAVLYQQFGEQLKQHFQGWQVALIISNPELGFRLGIRSQKPITLYNGALECKLLRFTVEESAFFIPKAKNQNQRLEQITQAIQTEEVIDSGTEMFVNRLRKNIKKMRKWAKQHNVNCYRVYDADLPEYSVAIDLYYGEKLWVNIQEYAPPKTIEAHKANQRLAGIMAQVPKIFDIPKEQVFLKIRRKQKGTEQYQKYNDLSNFHRVNEGSCEFWVNFEDYLDTGLFLDHRPLRSLLEQQAKDKRFLNLFAYTGTATIHAAKGGAKSSLTVDMSNTYLDWAKRNLELNNIQGDHQFLQVDCLDWLENHAQKEFAGQFDLIFLDPPTFSNSKRMEDAFDVQNDHAALIQQTIELLAPNGVLYFSTNFKRFKLDKIALEDYIIEDISASTIPQDFSRTPNIHYCWRIME